MTFTVTKHAKNRFLVEGTIAIVAGKRANEAYARMFTTRKAAETDARTWEICNTNAQADYEADQAARRAAAAAYLAKRAQRPAPAQLNLF